VIPSNFDHLSPLRRPLIISAVHIVLLNAVTLLSPHVLHAPFEELNIDTRHIHTQIDSLSRIDGTTNSNMNLHSKSYVKTQRQDCWARTKVGFALVFISCGIRMGIVTDYI